MEQGPGGDRPEDYELTNEERERILDEADPQKVADSLEAARYAQVLREEQERLDAIARQLQESPNQDSE